jgi:hypothetical protein
LPEHVLSKLSPRFAHLLSFEVVRVAIIVLIVGVIVISRVWALVVIEALVVLISFIIRTVSIIGRFLVL